MGINPSKGIKLSKTEKSEEENDCQQCHLPLAIESGAINKKAFIL